MPEPVPADREKLFGRSLVVPPGPQNFHKPPAVTEPAPGHSDCAEQLRQAAARDPEGTLEITISAEPPLVAGPYTTAPFVCPHGVSFWIEPTGEQIAKWVKDGTP